MHKLGWTPDVPDARDHQFMSAIPPAKLPPKVDLRSKCPPVLDQGDLGSCTANAIANAHFYCQMNEPKKTTHNDFPPSRLFIYYNERVMEGTVSSDSGAMIRDGFKSIAKIGVCPETEWPYHIAAFTKRPPSQCYTDALRHQALSYKRVFQTLSQMKGCLAQGFPFVFGFGVYESFESDEVANTGIVPMPTAQEQMLGGHAVLCVGYDDATRRFTTQNSWGEEWGDNGYFYIPYSYVSNPDLADDLWRVTLVEE
jgi:C1A family cysteine protease